MVQLLDGRRLANQRAAKLKEEVKKLKEEVKKLKQDGITPLFCVINIGDDAGSQIYLKTKKKRAEEVGIAQRVYQLPATESQNHLLALIDQLNADQNVSGIMIQLPVPSQIDLNAALGHIDPEKDVDCLTPSNIGRLWRGDHFVEPATAHGILALMDYYHIPLQGRNIVIIGRSSIVGKPLAALLLERNATVSILHSQTQNLQEYTKRADLLISAAGHAGLVTASMVKEGAVVVDVGINRVYGKTVGDIDFASVAPKASYITPVPGGIGPLTVEALMEQVVKLTRRKNGR